jgi:hypothetical protein
MARAGYAKGLGRRRPHASQGARFAMEADQRIGGRPLLAVGGSGRLLQFRPLIWRRRHGVVECDPTWIRHRALGLRPRTGAASRARKPLLPAGACWTRGRALTAGRLYRAQHLLPPASCRAVGRRSCHFASTAIRAVSRGAYPSGRFAGSTVLASASTGGGVECPRVPLSLVSTRSRSCRVVTAVCIRGSPADALASSV